VDYDWHCRMFLWSAYLYEAEDNPALSDHDYDQLCICLVRWYPNLPEWFTSRVPREDLEAGTGSGVTLTPEEIAQAHWWRDEHIPAMRKEMDEHRASIARTATRTTRRGPGRKPRPKANPKGQGEGPRS
jgi:hypothetical protein